MLLRHAEERCKQRWISRDVVDLIMTYGGRPLGHKGALKYFMDRKTRERARCGLGLAEFRRFADRLDTYSVVGDSTIVTAAKCKSRIRASKAHKPVKPRRGRGRRRS